MALNRSDKSRILRSYFPGMTRNSEMSTEPSPYRLSRQQLLLVYGQDRTCGSFRGRPPLCRVEFINSTSLSS